MKTSKTPGQLFDELANAPRRTDTARLTAELYRATTTRFGPFFRSRNVSADDAEDLCQDLALKLIRLAESGPKKLDDPDAYLRRIARNLACDHHRRRQRQRRASETLANDPTHSTCDHPVIPGRSPGARREDQLDAFVEAYASRALQTTRGNPAVQLWAWYWLRVRRARGDEVAKRLRAHQRANAGRSSVWKWAQRGAALVEKLAESDPDPKRAAVMQRAYRLAST